MEELYTLEQLRNGNFDHEMIKEIHLPETEDWREWVDASTIYVDDERNVLYNARSLDAYIALKGF